MLALCYNLPLIKEEKGRPIMASAHDIESARLHMLEARKALEDYEILKGFSSSYEHKKLVQEFTKATQAYLTLSEPQQ